MRFELSFRSGVPAYLQIAEQVKHAAASGALRPGDGLPSIRALAEDLRINRNTVAKAYGQLEHEGIVENQQGRGAFISSRPSPFGKAVRNGILTGAIDAAIVQAHHFQVDSDDFVKLVHERLEAFQARLKKQEGVKR